MPYKTTPWLFACTLFATLPHFAYQPRWLIALFSLLFMGTVFSWYRQYPLLPRFLRSVLALAACVGIYLEYRSIWGSGAGVSLLVLLIALKLLEIKTPRDGMVLITLSLFLLLTQFFESQEFLIGVWVFMAMICITATLLRFSADEMPMAATLKYTALLIAQSLPLVLIFFLLFPRIENPLWGLPGKNVIAKTGLTDRLRPGSIAEIVQNTETAFRVRFLGNVPEAVDRYWRGPVLERFDGQEWLPGRAAGKENVVPKGKFVSYEMTLEPNENNWLLALDAPIEIPPNTSLDGKLTLLSNQFSATGRTRLKITSATDFEFNKEEDAQVLRRNLRLPENGNPKTRALAEGWLNLAPADRVNAALRHFSSEGYSYTLTPPLLGQDSMDEFLFDSKAGFCEHFATAFVSLMRRANVPSRVVIGYQGGEINPEDGFLTVRQSDAHAWAEVWLEGVGWKRVDPTASVSPDRIMVGLESALSGALFQNAGFLQSLRYRWEAFNNAWDQYVLGYSEQQQKEVFSNLGFENFNWADALRFLGAVVFMVLLLLILWVLKQKVPQTEAEILWKKSLRYLARKKIENRIGETPWMLAKRVEKESPSLASAARQVVENYLACHYAPVSEKKLTNLKAAVRRLCSISASPR